MFRDHYYFLPEMATRRYLIAQTVLQIIALLTFTQFVLFLPFSTLKIQGEKKISLLP